MTGWAKIAVLLLTGVFTGFLSLMMGGGETIMVPAGAVGDYAHWKLGNAVTKLLAGLIPGIFIGTYLGGRLALVLSEAVLRVIFAAVLIWIGVRNLRTKAPQLA